MIELMRSLLECLANQCFGHLACSRSAQVYLEWFRNATNASPQGTQAHDSFDVQLVEP